MCFFNWFCRNLGSSFFCLGLCDSVLASIQTKINKRHSIKKSKHNLKSMLLLFFFSLEIANVSNVFHCFFVFFIIIIICNTSKGRCTLHKIWWWSTHKYWKHTLGAFSVWKYNLLTPILLFEKIICAATINTALYTEGKLHVQWFTSFVVFGQ